MGRERSTGENTTCLCFCPLIGSDVDGIQGVFLPSGVLPIMDHMFHLLVMAVSFTKW